MPFDILERGAYSAPRSSLGMEANSVNVDYLNAARERISNVPLLINAVSRRVRQLDQGQRPLVKPDDRFMPNLDLALKEIAEGKLTVEMAFTPPDTPSSSDEKLITL